VQTADEVMQSLLSQELTPNVPAGKVTKPAPDELPVPTAATSQTVTTSP
jgi:hypothetical protein